MLQHSIAHFAHPLAGKSPYEHHRANHLHQTFAHSPGVLDEMTNYAETPQHES